MTRPSFAAAEWQRRGGSRLRHAGQGAHAFQKTAHEGAGLQVEFVAGERQRELRGEQMLRFEAGIHGQQTGETHGQQTGADQQHEGQRDLGNHQGGAGAQRPSLRGAGPFDLPENGIQIAPHQMEHGQDPETQAGEQRHQPR